MEHLLSSSQCQHEESKLCNINTSSERPRTAPSRHVKRIHLKNQRSCTKRTSNYRKNRIKGTGFLPRGTNDVNYDNYVPSQQEGTSNGRLFVGCAPLRQLSGDAEQRSSMVSVFVWSLFDIVVVVFDCRWYFCLLYLKNMKFEYNDCLLWLIFYSIDTPDSPWNVW